MAAPASALGSGVQNAERRPSRSSAPHLGVKIPFERKATPNPVTTGQLLPTLHCIETAETIELSTELPGVEPNDIHLLFPSDFQIQVYLEKRDVEANNKPLGHFSQAFTLPFKISKNALTTTYDPNGKFTIVVPKPTNSSASESIRS